MSYNKYIIVVLLINKTKIFNKHIKIVRCTNTSHNILVSKITETMLHEDHTFKKFVN